MRTPWANNKLNPPRHSRRLSSLSFVRRSDLYIRLEWIGPAGWRRADAPTKAPRLRNYYRRAHRRCPNAASSIARAKARVGTHCPPCAMNRADASTTGCLLSSADAAKTGATTDSARANCCLSNAPGSRRPSPSNVRMENVVRTTRTGSLATSSTTTSAMRARCPAKVDKQWLAGSRNIRWNLVLGSCQRVSSRAMRNFRQENPIAAPMHEH